MHEGFGKARLSLSQKASQLFNKLSDSGIKIGVDGVAVHILSGQRDARAR
jgi:hypothetical protein